jgi:hypothetical protein
VASASAGWAALACRRARQVGEPGADARIWLVVSLLFLGLAVARIAQAGPWLGAVLRRLARASQLYGDRRPFQVVVTLALTAFALVALGVGLRYAWEALKRYRLAAGCVAAALASAGIRFVSLHEVDALDRTWPWVRVVIEVGIAALATTAAIVRAWQAARSITRFRTAA